MKRSFITAALLLITTAAFAQTEQDKIVAVINGETITKSKLDTMYGNMSAMMRSQYDKAGGKMAFLDNYIAKRLLIQEALKSGFDRRPDVQASLEAARESALFDRYVKDVVVSDLVSETDLRKYYDEHKEEFAVPDQVKVRHIVVSWNNKTKAAAFEQIKQVMTEIRSAIPPKSPESAEILLSRFGAAARKYSEDGAAQAGGDLGWVTRGSLDKNFEDAAFNMKPMSMSGIVESQFGYHLIYVEEKKPAGTDPFANVKADIRERLMAQKAADVMGSVKRLTNELRARSKVAFYPENIN